MTSSSGTTTNSTSSINGTALNNTSTTFISSNLGALALACGAPEADAICVASLWAPEYLRDAWQLLALKAAAADASTSQRLASWRGTVPPCTNSSSTGTCVLCDDSAPPSMCGGPRPSDGALMCNWRFIACRDRRVVTINVAYMVRCAGAALHCLSVVMLYARHADAGRCCICHCSCTGPCLCLPASAAGQWHSAGVARPAAHQRAGRHAAVRICHVDQPHNLQVRFSMRCEGACILMRARFVVQRTPCPLIALLPPCCRLRGPVWGQLPLNYTAWSRLRAFELTSTALTGTIPPSYFSSWTALENFTLDGASISGHLPPPWGCPNLTSYIVQNTPVVSNASSPLWVFSPLASSLTRLTALGLGERRRCVLAAVRVSKSSSNQGVVPTAWPDACTNACATFLQAARCCSCLAGRASRMCWPPTAGRCSSKRSAARPAASAALLARWCPTSPAWPCWSCHSTS